MVISCHQGANPDRDANSGATFAKEGMILALWPPRPGAVSRARESGSVGKGSPSLARDRDLWLTGHGLWSQGRLAGLGIAEGWFPEASPGSG